MSLTITRQVHFKVGRGRRKELREGTPPEPKPMGRVPRISRLMALAIRLKGLVDEGHVADYAELAALGHVTRARMTQIMNLLHLAPDIQEALLFLPRTLSGRDPITERNLRPLTAVAGLGQTAPHVGGGSWVGLIYPAVSIPIGSGWNQNQPCIQQEMSGAHEKIRGPRLGPKFLKPGSVRLARGSSIRRRAKEKTGLTGAQLSDILADG